MGYSNSPLASYVRISPNKNSPRNHDIDRLTIHCYVGQVSIESMSGWLCNPNANASANYGIANDGRIGLFVEERDRSWCSSSRANDNRAITIECASDTKHPYAINDKVYGRLIELAVDICERNGKKKLLWLGDKDTALNYNPAPDEMVITCHRWFAAKACPGDYIYNRLGTIAETVTKLLGNEPVSPPVSVADKYVVRLAFDKPETQTNSYNNLDYAKAEADRHPGYSVYIAATGERVYTSAKKGYTPTEWIALMAPICQEVGKKLNILTSAILAQTALETGWGSTDLTSKYNVLGMKVDLINSTWKEHSVWGGKTYRKVTPEYHNGQLVYVEDDFRVYDSFKQCIEDYENFLLYVRNNKGYKYRRVQGKTNPAEVINIIRVGTGTNEHPEGYCTDPNYETKILAIINQYNLTQFDSYMTVTKDIYAVQRSLDETQFRLGLYSDLENAKRQADEHWGYKVYNIENNLCVYEPRQNIVQRLVAKCLQFNDYVILDAIWRYYNNKKSAPTFWETRDKKLFMTNCMGAVAFALKDIGIPASALQWYGQKGGIRWLTDNARKEAEKYFDIFEIKTKTVNQCIKDGTIVFGDIITYMGMNHTNIYLGNGTSYDAGHAYCKGSGEGAEYQKWVGETPYGTYKVACIIRLKASNDTEVDKDYVYRVQVGAFQDKARAERRADDVKVKTAELLKKDRKKYEKDIPEGGCDCWIDSPKMHYIYCGSFADENKAKIRVNILRDAGFDAFIKKVKL